MATQTGGERLESMENSSLVSGVHIAAREITSTNVPDVKGKDSGNINKLSQALMILLSKIKGF